MGFPIAIYLSYITGFYQFSFFDQGPGLYHTLMESLMHNVWAKTEGSGSPYQGPDVPLGMMRIPWTLSSTSRRPQQFPRGPWGLRFFGCFFTWIYLLFFYFSTISDFQHENQSSSTPRNRMHRPQGRLDLWAFGLKNPDPSRFLIGWIFRVQKSHPKRIIGLYRSITPPFVIRFGGGGVKM